MRRIKRQKAVQQLSKDVWNQMWQSFCPWVGGIDVSPLQLKPIPVRRNPRIRSLIVGLALLGLTFTNAQAAISQTDGQIVLASLNNTLPSAHIDHYPQLFGTSEQRYEDIRPFTKWTSVLNRFKQDFAASLQRPEVQEWMSFLASIKNKPNEDKIAAVNDYMNRMKFVSDSQNYGVSDYWATPMEFLAKGGDCEDYAIAKYISLRAAGIPQDDMRLAIVYDRVMRMPHALLIIYDGKEAKVLDNQNPAIMQSADITRYKPIYSISQVAWWRH